MDFNKAVAQLKCNLCEICFVAKQFSVFDIFAIVLVPLVVTFVYYLPESIKLNLQLTKDNFQLHQLLTAQFTHFTFDHYFYNILFFLLLFSFIIALSIKLNVKRRILLIFPWFFLVLPVITSALDIFVFHFRTSKGLSTIIGALFGLLFSLAIFYLESKFGEAELSKRLYNIYGPIYILILTFSSFLLGSCITLILNFVLLVLLFRNYLTDIFMQISIAFASLLPAFLSISISGSSAVNVPAHFLGVLVGFYLSVAVLRL